jgi:hypothetical protein
VLAALTVLSPTSAIFSIKLVMLSPAANAFTPRVNVAPAAAAAPPAILLNPPTAIPAVLPTAVKPIPAPLAAAPSILKLFPAVCCSLLNAAMPEASALLGPLPLPPDFPLAFLVLSF